MSKLKINFRKVLRRFRSFKYRLRQVKNIPLIKLLECHEIIYSHINDQFFIYTNQEFIEIRPWGKVKDRLISIAHIVDEGSVWKL